MTGYRQNIASTPQLAAAGVVLAALLLMSVQDAIADAARPLSRTKYTNGASMRRVFGNVVSDANQWTVRIKSEDRVVAYGTVVRSDGYIVSKASQLSGEIVCRFADGRELPASYIGYSSEHDVALLKVEETGLRTVAWQDAADPQVGRWVITPDQQGAPNSVGVVSVARRSIPRVHESAVLGIHMVVERSPVTVESVVDDSAAARASLQPGDAILRVDDVLIESPAGMKHEISRRSPGDTISLKVKRDDRELTLRATLTHPFGEFQSRIAMQNQMGGSLSQRRNGFPVVLQHDSVLDPSECGGPLVDLSGRAIGINIARAGRTESYAIPDDVIRPLIDELLTGDYPPPGENQPTVAADVTDDANSTPPESDTSQK